MRTFSLTALALVTAVFACHNTKLLAQDAPPITLKFVNNTDAPATLYWIADDTPQGKKSYGVIQAGTAGEVQTYPQHRWQFIGAKAAIQVIATKSGTHELKSIPAPVVELAVRFINNTDFPGEVVHYPDTKDFKKQNVLGAVPAKKSVILTLVKGQYYGFGNGKQGIGFIAQKSGEKVLGGIVPPAPPENTDKPKLATDVINDLILKKVNEYRASQGVQALKKDAFIQGQCQNHSQDMANRYNGQFQLDHNGFNTRFTAIRQNDTSVTTASENVFCGGDGTEEQIATQAFNAWKNSPGHNRNMLAGNMTKSGVAVVKKKGVVYITQMFAAGN